MSFMIAGMSDERENFWRKILSKITCKFIKKKLKDIKMKLYISITKIGEKVVEGKRMNYGVLFWSILV